MDDSILEKMYLIYYGSFTPADINIYLWYYRTTSGSLFVPAISALHLKVVSWKGFFYVSKVALLITVRRLTRSYCTLKKTQCSLSHLPCALNAAREADSAWWLNFTSTTPSMQDTGSHGYKTLGSASGKLQTHTRNWNITEKSYGESRRIPIGGNIETKWYSCCNI